MEFEMKTSENKRFCTKLAHLAQTCGAGPAEMMVVLMQSVFADQRMTTKRLAELCNINRATLHRMKADPKQRLKQLSDGMKNEVFFELKEKSGEEKESNIAVEAIFVPANALLAAETSDDTQTKNGAKFEPFAAASQNGDKIPIQTPSENGSISPAQVQGVVSPQKEPAPITDKERIQYFMEVYSRTHRLTDRQEYALCDQLRACTQKGYTLAGINAILDACIVSTAWKEHVREIPSPNSFLDVLIQLAEGADFESHPSVAWREIGRCLAALRA